MEIEENVGLLMARIDHDMIKGVAADLCMKTSPMIGKAAELLIEGLYRLREKIDASLYLIIVNLGLDMDFDANLYMDTEVGLNRNVAKETIIHDKSVIILQFKDHLRYRYPVHSGII